MIMAIVLAIIIFENCHTSKVISSNSTSLDTLNSYSGTSGYFIDERDGKKYKWVRIGDHKWMAENLAYKADSGCVAFKHKERKVKKYGYYYGWETAIQSCPEGWHLPTENEINDLKKYIGDYNYNAFDSLKKNNDYGLNLKRYGYYDFEKGEFLNIRLPFLGQSEFWASDSYLTKSGQKCCTTFYKDYFWRRSGSSSKTSETYLPVRCVKKCL